MYVVYAVCSLSRWYIDLNSMLIGSKIHLFYIYIYACVFVSTPLPCVLHLCLVLLLLFVSKINLLYYNTLYYDNIIWEFNSL